MAKKERKTWKDRAKGGRHHLRQVPQGKLVTDEQLRDRMARDAGGDSTCSKVTGLVIKGISEEAGDGRGDGQDQVTPWWSVIAKNGSLKTKLAGGVEDQTQLLAEEGHEVVQQGKKHVVVGLESSLAEI